MDLACLSFKQHRALLSAGLRKIYHYKSIFTGYFFKAWRKDKRQETRDKKQKIKNKRQETKDKKQKTRNKRQETKDKKQKTRNKRHETNEQINK